MRVRRSSDGCGVAQLDGCGAAQLVVLQLAVRQARVRFRLGTPWRLLLPIEEATKIQEIVLYERILKIINVKKSGIIPPNL